MSPKPDHAAKEFWHTRFSGSATVGGSSSGSTLSQRNLPSADPTAAASTHEAPPAPPTLKSPFMEEGRALASQVGKNDCVHRKCHVCMDAKAEEFGHHPRRADVVDAHVKGTPCISTDMSVKDFPVASGGLSTLPARPGEIGWLFKSLQEALGAGYHLIKWDGKTCMPFVTADGHVFAVCVGQPDDPTYAKACQRAYHLKAEEGRLAHFTDSEMHHKRSDFPAVNVGVTMGIGATYPTNLRTGNHSEMFDRFLSDKDIVRIANFTDGRSVQSLGPECPQRVSRPPLPSFKKLLDLRRIFSRSIYPAAAFNVGPNVFTVAHRDGRNVPGRWCGIQALGRFDPTKGGHIVFPDLELVVEFPAGALILIPSATLTHANIPAQEGDSRALFTQYCSSGLFRYTECSYRTEAQLRRDDPKEYKRLQALKETRWQRDYHLYSLLTDLVVPVANRVDKSSLTP
ncbi:hypothetical protein DXG01_011110 [Tephrocybe rancida]|nr:hypothetical protein DXG01_011110 [Tephrocybe rancida]